MSDNSVIKKEVKRWLKKTKINPTNINLTKYNLTVDIEDQTINFVIPNNYPEKDGCLILVDYPELKPRFSWLSALNTYVVERNPSLGRLLWKLDQLYNKNYTEIEDLLDTEFVDNLNVEEIYLERKLRKNLEKVQSENVFVQNEHSKGRKLFNGAEAGQILLTELMDLRRKYKDSSSIRIEPVENSVFEWEVVYTNFNSKSLSENLAKLDVSHILVRISFHKKYYPGYPPFVKMVYPELKNRLKQRISNLKMVQLDYWTPARSMEFVIKKLQSILNEHAQIDIDRRIANTKNLQELESIVIKLGSMVNCEEEDELDKDEYINYSQKSQKSQNSQNGGSNSFWKSGTGYGHSGTKDWNPEEYIALQKERDTEIQSVLHRVVECIQNCTNSEINQAYQIIDSSLTVPFIKSYLNGTNMLEISKHRDLYQNIFTLLQNMVTEEGVFLFTNDSNGANIYNLLKTLSKEAQNIVKLANISDTDDNLTDFQDAFMVTALFEMLEPLYQEYEKDQKNKKEILVEKNSDSDKVQNMYFNAMSDKRVDMVGFVERGFKYQTSNSTTRKMVRRLTREIGALTNSLPIYFESSVFVRVDDKNTRCMRVLITGPDKTPYNSGVFLFDMYIPDEFPSNPPKMLFINHGGKRFNPNLYNSGKVCLSLLGTWSGKGGENWNENTSSLIQLFVSIQAQILIDHPYFNEPGHERSYDTARGKQSSREYNNYIRYYTMNHTVYDILNSIDSYPEFKDVIVNHFKLKKDYILKTYKQWLNESFSLDRTTQQSGTINKTMYTEKYNQIEELLNGL